MQKSHTDLEVPVHLQPLDGAGRPARGSPCLLGRPIGHVEAVRAALDGLDLALGRLGLALCRGLDHGEGEAAAVRMRFFSGFPDFWLVNQVKCRGCGFDLTYSPHVDTWRPVTSQQFESKG